MDFLKPVPRAPLPDISDIKYTECGEALVDLSLYGFLTEPKYFLRGIKGASDKMFLRKSVAEKLLAAQSALPDGLKFKIFDAWRPLSVQKALFWEYYGVVELANPEIKDRDTLLSLTREFVSYPSEDKSAPFAHNTGGAVDLTLVDKNGKELFLGSPFDDFSNRAYTHVYERSENTAVRDARRILYNCLCAQGFTNLPSEWWHFDYGDGFWSFYSGKDAIYKGISSL